MQVCLFCGGDASEPDHQNRCDGQQGRVEAEAARADEARADERPDDEPPPPYQQDFLDFHDENPQVYARLRDIAREVRRTGRRHFGIRVIWERLRWIATFETTDPNVDLKLNDHYTRHYARLLMEREPDLAGMFEVRDRPVRPLRRAG